MILAALDRLRSRFDFELILVQGRPHEEAMALYRAADLAIDQVLAGWYGGFAVEMMAMGKPVACAIREEDMRFVPHGMRAELPTLRLRPDHLVDDLATILERRDTWPEIGARSRRFVERWHDPDRIARAMVAAYAHPESAFDLS
jgi:glycosyltransferase involved in cell wall biosynthesis